MRSMGCSDSRSILSVAHFPHFPLDPLVQRDCRRLIALWCLSRSGFLEGEERESRQHRLRDGWMVGTPDSYSSSCPFARTFEPQDPRLRPEPPLGPIVGDPDADYSGVLGSSSSAESGSLSLHSFPPSNHTVGTTRGRNRTHTHIHCLVSCGNFLRPTLRPQPNADFLLLTASSAAAASFNSSRCCFSSLSPSLTSASVNPLLLLLPHHRLVTGRRAPLLRLLLIRRSIRRHPQLTHQSGSTFFPFSQSSSSSSSDSPVSCFSSVARVPRPPASTIDHHTQHHLPPHHPHHLFSPAPFTEHPLSMLPFEAPTIFEQLPRFLFKMPRVHQDQKSKYESDDLFRRLGRESEVRPETPVVPRRSLSNARVSCHRSGTRGSGTDLFRSDRSGSRTPVWKDTRTWSVSRFIH